MTLALVVIVIVGVGLPHALRLDHVKPTTAALLWSTALTLRALIAVSIALAFAVLLPATPIFKTLTHWCQHTVLPGVGVHFDIHGHVVGAVGSYVPAVLISLSLVAATYSVCRVGRAVSRALARESLGAGPQDSIIVGGSEVVLASAGLWRPAIVVSAGALVELDEEELAAGIAHERGHVLRRHHLVLAYAEGCRALSRFMPGTRRAVSEVRFHLERDADAWAIRAKHDPCALASAICKAATAMPGSSPVLAPLAGGGIERRVDELLDRNTSIGGPLRRRFLDSTAVLMACVAVAASVALPAQAVAGDRGHVAEHSEHHCVS